MRTADQRFQNQQSKLFRLAIANRRDNTKHFLNVIEEKEIRKNLPPLPHPDQTKEMSSHLKSSYVDSREASGPEGYEAWARPATMSAATVRTGRCSRRAMERIS